MKIVIVSDTHNKIDQINIPKGDILIHAGDFTGRGSFDELEHFNNELGRLPHKYKVCISGNHDFLFERDPELARSLMTNCIYLEDESIIIEGLKFYGSPWTPRFHDWAFNLNRGPEIRQKWDMIPEDTDVLITHGPPYKILDDVPRNMGMSFENVGCEELALAVQRVKPMIHAFGHLHESYGMVENSSTTFINAASMNGSYLPVNKPFVIEINNGKIISVETA